MQTLRPRNGSPQGPPEETAEGSGQNEPTQRNGPHRHRQQQLRKRSRTHPQNTKLRKSEPKRQENHTGTPTMIIYSAEHTTLILLSRPPLYRCYFEDCSSRYLLLQLVGHPHDPSPDHFPPLLLSLGRMHLLLEFSQPMHIEQTSQGLLRKQQRSVLSLLPYLLHQLRLDLEYLGTHASLQIAPFLELQAVGNRLFQLGRSDMRRSLADRQIVRTGKRKSRLVVGRHNYLLLWLAKLGKIAFGRALLGKIVQRTRMILPQLLNHTAHLFLVQLLPLQPKLRLVYLREESVAQPLHSLQPASQMKQTLPPKGVTKQSAKSELTKGGPSRSLSKKESVGKPAKEAPKVKASKYKIDAITKDNFQASQVKLNITEIPELPLKYVLRCIEGLYKNRFLFITTHPEGEVFGSGDVKLNGLTLQIEGVGLAPKHAQLKYDGFKSFNVMDFGSESGTWMNIAPQGVEIRDGEHYSIGPHLVSFHLAQPIDEIEEICMVYHLTYLSDLLVHNGLRTLSQLFAADYANFEGYPFDKKQVEKLHRVCDETRSWYEQGRKYRRLNMVFLNEPLKDLEIEIGWESFHISSDPDFIFHAKSSVGEITKGKLIPQGKVFSRIPNGKYVPLSLHSQIKLGNLSFEMTRFNAGWGEDLGFRTSMEDGLIVEEDIGGSEWKLISLFAVIDGHGGVECMKFIKENLVSKVREWTSLLDEAGDLNEMVKVLMNKTFFELDWEFQKQYPELSLTCGATALVTLIIESKAYTFHVGDCKSFLFRNDVLYKMNIDHLPSRGDQRNRIEAAGGFVQYDRLMGKCTLSRCLGQFEYKSTEDYENQLKGKLKSCLSCIPDMVCFDLKVDSDDFILLSTDGIFESMDIFQLTDFIREKYDKLELEENPNKIISGIIENCKIISPQSDNMALILLIIRKGELRA